MNVTIRGKVREILEAMVSHGYANTMSEAIRLSVVNFGKEHLSEDELVRRKMDFMDRQVMEGKKKLLTAEEALGEYAKYLKK